MRKAPIFNACKDKIAVSQDQQNRGEAMSKKGSATRVAHVRTGKLFFASAQENTSSVPLSFKQKRKDLHALVWEALPLPRANKVERRKNLATL